MLIDLTPKECALIHKAVEASDRSYIGEGILARAIQNKVLPGALEYIKQEQVKAKPAPVARKRISR